jgi:hypothetical protein
MANATLRYQTTSKEMKSQTPSLVQQKLQNGHG